MSNNTRKANNNVVKMIVLVVLFWAIVSLACSGGDGNSTKTGSPDNNDWSNTQEQIKLEVYNYCCGGVWIYLTYYHR